MTNSCMNDPPCVLIVEDDAQITRALRMRLRSAGYAVLVAEDAERGIALATENQPDVIVMDIQLPRKDGLTALCEIHRKEKTQTTPIVVLSASPNERRHALELGARYFLNKPFTSNTLLAAIQASLSQPDPNPQHGLASRLPRSNMHNSPAHVAGAITHLGNNAHWHT